MTSESRVILLLHYLASIPAWGALVMHLMERDSSNRKTHMLCLRVFIDTCTSMLVFHTFVFVKRELMVYTIYIVIVSYYMYNHYV